MRAFGRHEHFLVLGAHMERGFRACCLTCRHGDVRLEWREADERHDKLLRTGGDIENLELALVIRYARSAARLQLDARALQHAPGSVDYAPGDYPAVSLRRGGIRRQTDYGTQKQNGNKISHGNLKFEIAYKRGE